MYILLVLANDLFLASCLLLASCLPMICLCAAASITHNVMLLYGVDTHIFFFSNYIMNRLDYIYSFIQQIESAVRLE